MVQDNTEPSAWWHRVASRLFGRGSLGRYGLLGLVGLSLDIASYAVFLAVDTVPVVAAIVSSLLGMLTNYVVNARFTFGVSVSVIRGLRFVTVGLTGVVVATGLFQVLLWLGAGVWWAKVVSLGVVVVAQYLGNRYWTFREK